MNKLDTKTRQKQILEASLNLIKEGGIQNLTMKRISAKVGISEQAIYRHYKSKQDILCNVIRYFNDHFESVFQQVASISVLAERINVFIDSHLSYFQKYPATAAVIFSEEIFQYDSKLAKSINALVEHRIMEITRIIRLAQEEGSIRIDRPAEDLACIILGSLRFLVTTWRLGGFKYSLVDKGNSMKTTLLKMLY